MTRFLIAKQVGPDAYRTIAGLCDGYPEHTGTILLEHYDAPEKVDKLLDLGDIYYLGKNLDWPPGTTFEEKQNDRDGTMAFARDFGDVDVAAEVLTLQSGSYYRMDLNGNYPSTPYSTEQLTGTTDSTLILSQLANSYTGFSYSHGKVNGVTVTSTTIAPDGSRVIDLYYSRNRYTVTVNKGQGISGVSGGGTYYYGASVTIDATVATKYAWYRWTGTHTTYTQCYTFTMPAYNVTDTANAEPVLELEPITPNASYQETTQVISAFRVINPSVISYTGAEDVTVTFQVKNSTTGAVIYISTEDTVIIPPGEEGLLYVKWTVPASVSGNAVTVTATIQKGNTVWTVASIAALLAVVVLLYAGGKLLLAFALSFGFLTVRFRDTTILQTIGYAVRFFVTRQQCYLWR